MATANVEIQMDVPAGVTVGEYERIDDGHSFHVSWELPDACRCETCKEERPLNVAHKDKFLAIRADAILAQMNPEAAASSPGGRG